MSVCVYIGGKTQVKMPRKPKEQRGLQLIHLIDPTQISYDLDAFDNLISSQGVLLVHQKAMRCPIGVQDRNDIRHSSDDHEGCFNGFVYHNAGCVLGFFQNSTAGPLQIPEGLLEPGSCLLTVPRFYDKTQKPIIVAPFDRFVLKDCETRVVTWETIEASQTGVDRTQYPIVDVEYLMDSRGISYFQGKDFEIRSGRVCWLGEKRPGFDPKLGRGAIYSIRYQYVPAWYVKYLVHEVRVAQVTNPATFERRVERMPYAVLLQREYVFLSGQRSDDGNEPRDSRSPESGGNLGPR